jgi:hypothetical protein
MTEIVNDSSFTKKISVLYETPPLWSEEEFDNVKNLKDYKDKLEKMSNISYYIKSDDLETIINNTDKKIYLRLVIESPYKYKKNELALAKKENEDNMSISDSPGRAKNTSKSSENIKVKKSRKSVRGISNNDDQQKKIISIKSKTHLLCFTKDDEKHSIFICNMKDDIIYCNFINDEDIKGSKFAKLLTYESVDVSIGDKNVMVNSRNIKNLSFPLYFIFQNHELNIDDFTCTIESILESI